MNKNIIKQHLSETFLSEEKKAKGTAETDKIKEKSKAINKAAMKDAAKEMKDYDKSSKDSEKENADAVKKYENSKGDQELHDVGENQAGSIINLESENPPDETWEEKQRQAITGKDSTQGNAVYDKDGNPLGNVITADQAGFTGPEANQKIYDDNKKFKKKKDKSMKSAGMGDVQVGQQQFNENKNSKRLNEGLSPKGGQLIQKWIDNLDYRGAAVKLIDSILVRMVGLGSSDLGDTSIFANGLDTVEEFLIANEFDSAFENAKETAREMIEDEGGGDIFENKKINKKEKMKRLVFNKPFDGVTNALNLIPEAYKVNDKEFHMTDGNEKYEIRWEGDLNEGRAIITNASDKNLMTEDMQKMKHLMGYKSEETLGNLKGSERIDENASFNDVWNKTKTLLSETEEGKDETLND